MVHLLGAGVVVRNVDVQRVLAFLQSQHERVCDWRVGMRQIQQVAGVLCQHGPVVLGEARAGNVRAWNLAL